MAISIHHLDVSPELFLLATQAVQRCSVAMNAFASIHDVVAREVERALSVEISSEEIEMALSIEINGALRISLIVRESWRTTLRTVQERLSERAGRRLSVKQIVAVLLQMS